MDPGAITHPRHICLALVLATLGCTINPASARAQPASSERDSSAPAAAPQPLTSEEGFPEAQAVPGDYYTSPLKKLGTDLLLGSYFIGFATSAIYLAAVYPVQAVSGSSKLEPVMLWLLVPIAGPWFAQSRASVASKPFWRAVLIGDGILQAGGLVIGLIGAALSGTRTLDPEPAARVSLKLGVAGAGLTGVTLSIHNM